METKGKSSAKTNAAKTNKKEAAKQEQPKKVTMAKYLDTLLLAGGKFEDILAASKAEADKRKVGTLATASLVRAHINYRIRRNELPIKFEDGVVSVVSQ